MTVYAFPGTEGAKVEFKSRYEHFIGGEWTPPVKGQYFENVTPVTGKVFCEVARGTAEDIDAALDAAWKAAPAWGATSPAERALVLHRIADRMEENLEMLAVAETWDNGKAVRETLNADVPLAIDHFRYFAGAIRAQEGGLSQVDEDTVAYHFHEPLGVVGQIIPWNFPLLMGVWKLAPALAAGNAVVIKPAEQTPASIMVFIELIADLLPAGVVNVVNGFGLEAEAVDHVDDAGRQQVRDQLDEHHDRGRGLLGGLDHDGVARGQRGRQLPHPHQQREVPRDDLADHAERLVEVVGDGVLVHLGQAALLRADRAGEVPEVVDGQRDVRVEGLPDGLAVVPRLRDRQHLEVLLHAVRDAVQHERPLGRRGGAPGRGGLPGGVEGGVDVLGRAAGDLAEHLARHGRDVLEVLALDRGCPLSADEVLVAGLELDLGSLGARECVDGHGAGSFACGCLGAGWRPAVAVTLVTRRLHEGCSRARVRGGPAQARSRSIRSSVATASARRGESVGSRRRAAPQSSTSSRASGRPR